MESINIHKIKYKFIAILMAFVIAIAPFGSKQKVKANTIEDTLKFSIPVVALILAALTSNGAISGGYQVSASDLSAIQKKAQANLQAAGANAVEQANRLGEAIKSGAESAKIKALASGAVIYAFLQAIQETLFSNVTDRSTNDWKFYCSTAHYNVNYKINNSKYFDYYLPLTASRAWSLEGTKYKTTQLFLNKGNLGYGNWPVILFYVLDNSGNYIDTFTVTANKELVFCDAKNTNNLAIIAEILALQSNVVYDASVSHISERESVTVPTVLPQTIISNINNWDGTSDLVLAPPLPYDIPTGEDLVIDPSYVGEGTIDPPKPTTDPDPPAEEEGISLPWLSALLALLGLGQIGGIDAGVQSGIDSIIDGITATAQDVYDGITDIAGTITGALSSIDATVQSGIDALTGIISVPLTNVSDFVLSVPDFFAIPEGVTLATPIVEQIPQVFPIVDQLNTALNKITVETRPLVIYYPYLDGSTKRIDLEWYEPAREQVKHGVGLLFKVVTALACFAMVSNVFGIGLRVGTGQAYSDRPGENNSGGRKKED